LIEMVRYDVRTAVIGTGSMGRNHARVYSELSDLVAVMDIDPKTSKEVGSLYGVEAYDELEVMLRSCDIDAVTVSGPTTTHHEAVLRCMEAGMDVLVEKPIADTPDKALQMIRKAQQTGRVLAVGMIERHNPIVRFTKEMIEKDLIGSIVSIGTKRLSNLPPRIKDVGVVTDIGVHDIDVMRYLSDSDVVSVHGIGGKVKNERFLDHATVLMRFANGMEGIMELSWLSPMKVRTVSVTGTNSIAEMDYIDQELKISTSSLGELDINNLWRIPQKYDIRRMRVMNEEPLRRELIDFLIAVKEDGQPLVGGTDGLRALEVAKAAELSIEENKVISL